MKLSFNCCSSVLLSVSDFLLSMVCSDLFLNIFHYFPLTGSLAEEAESAESQQYFRWPPVPALPWEEETCHRARPGTFLRVQANCQRFQQEGQWAQQWPGHLQHSRGRWGVVNNTYRSAHDVWVFSTHLELLGKSTQTLKNTHKLAEKDIDDSVGI